MPRIVGGSARGRLLKVPKGDVRPATARARKSIFDYLSDFLRDAQVLDLYCGSGGLGLEALSRGAAHAWFVDSSNRVLAVAEENAQRLGLDDRCRFARRDVFTFLKHLSDYASPRFDLIFAAPPYRIAQPQDLLEVIGECSALNPHGSVCLEYSAHTRQPQVDGFTLDRRRKFGETIIEVWDTG